MQTIPVLEEWKTETRTVGEFGLDRFAGIILPELDNHNIRMREKRREIAEDVEIPVDPPESWVDPTNRYMTSLRWKENDFLKAEVQDAVREFKTVLRDDEARFYAEFRRVVFGRPDLAAYRDEGGAPTAGTFSRAARSVGGRNFRDVVVMIPRSAESSVRAFKGFTPYSPLVVTDIYDRMIGVFDWAEVRVKPWMPNGHALVTLQNGERPTRFMARGPAFGDLELKDKIKVNGVEPPHSIRARLCERAFGFVANHWPLVAVVRFTDTPYTNPD